MLFGDEWVDELAVQPASERVHKWAASTIASDLVHHHHNGGHPLRECPSLGNAPRLVGTVMEELAQPVDGRPGASEVTETLHRRGERQSIHVRVGAECNARGASQRAENARIGGAAQDVLALRPGLFLDALRGIVVIYVAGQIRVQEQNRRRGFPKAGHAVDDDRCVDAPVRPSLSLLTLAI